MVQVLGHRGAAGLEPENTLRGFRKAIALGCDLTECDVWLSKDGKLMVIHDNDLERVTNTKGLVTEKTLEELKKLDAGKGEKIPALQELVELAKGKIKLVIEIKDFNAVAPLVELLKKNYPGKELEGVVVTSFFHDLMKEAKQLLSGLKTGVIFAGQPTDSVEVVRESDADYAVARFRDFEEKEVRKLQKAGLKVALWTVDKEDELKKAISWNPDIIITNRPDRLLKLLGR